LQFQTDGRGCDTDSTTAHEHWTFVAWLHYSLHFYYTRAVHAEWQCRTCLIGDLFVGLGSRSKKQMMTAMTMMISC